MDRFVWFVLLVVMSHLVTEFTRVTGYARGNRNELLLVNDTLIEPKTIQNMLLYPGQQEYSQYEPYYYQDGNGNGNGNGNTINTNHPQAYDNMKQQQYQQYQQHQQHQNPNGQIVIGPSSTQQGLIFSFRPLIDSIFEIPISTLRAVNNLVARLTGNYQSTTAAYTSQKSALGMGMGTGTGTERERATATQAGETERSNNLAIAVGGSPRSTRGKRSFMREEIE